MKKILYIRAQWLWDMISSIPKLKELKDEWHYVSMLFFDMRWLQKIQFKVKSTDNAASFNWWLNILNIFKNNNIIDDIFLVPYWYFKLTFFLLRNFRKFDEVIIPIKTNRFVKIWKIVWKKVTIYFGDSNDNSKYSNVIEGQINWKVKALNEYNFIKWDYKKVNLPENYMVIFPSAEYRSASKQTWIETIEYLLENNKSIVIIWSERESWLSDELKNKDYYNKIFDLTWKTSFEELNYILKNSKLNILWNGWPMWMWNLLNKNNINLHSISVFLLQPSVDNIQSFNLRPFSYPKCKPCEYCFKIKEWRPENCVYYWTKNEFRCKKEITTEKIIELINLY